ncbi:PREDICTED: aldehyde dehydrogenase family 3 member F1-like [Nelumbo nucifera]|uniref:Aldehyde dehydrogenase n=1 Tax=Nelumbo nucifera TaxID=4432 RepID=A0A1U8A8Z6_NELNU|nr:PREDICTED: aldehyde dehydrogenase family 3 member F1-like [Nelumbo nucifera]
MALAELGLGPLGDSLEELRWTFESGKTRSISWRKAQLQALLNFLRDNEEQILEAIHEDVGKHRVEAFRDEVGVLIKSLTHNLDCLEKWVAPKKTKLPLAFFPATAELLPEPLGLVIIFSSWNFPMSLALEPLIGAISAGNTAVIKPSEISPTCSSFLATVIPRYLDNKAIKVIEGGAAIAAQLLEEKWDKIFFTGSPRVGRIVMSAAAKHLTPVTLELGGKCPVVLDTRFSSSEMEVVVKRIAWGKWGLCNGQSCIGVDYVLVEEKSAFTLIGLLKKAINKFYGKNTKECNDYVRIINEHHFERLHKLIRDPEVANSIVHGGSVDKEKLFIEPTILLNPPLESEIMTEEIFGPFLPIITLKNIQQSAGFIKSRPKPLALYVFTKDETLKKLMISQTSSGSITFNDVAFQFLSDSLPFGGVGQSGMGRYHGKFSFDEFTHEKAVLRRTLLLDLEPRYPPWNDFKLKFIRLLYKYDYFGLLLLLLGLKR